MKTIFLADGVTTIIKQIFFLYHTDFYRKVILNIKKYIPIIIYSVIIIGNFTKCQLIVKFNEKKY